MYRLSCFYIELRDGKPVSHLKFYGRNELILADTFELRTYLSSGTIKGINVFLWAIAVLRHGGYLLLDEIENHFNTEIVASLIRFFLDARLNKNGGVLIFTTHYPELLDEFDRNDCINITRNTEGITVQNLTDILKRNDLKKSDAYMSDYLGGTAPLYDSYIALKRYIAKAVVALNEQGIIASHPMYDYNGKPVFVIDAQVFPGSSGSPVFVKSTLDSYYENELLVENKRFMLAGVISETFQKTNTIKLAEAKETAVPEVIGLGTVVKATEIRKLIDSIEINKK